jgi:hypothetical protein
VERWHHVGVRVQGQCELRRGSSPKM